jgi:tripartite-type tricarboxylate transporter receptor subunit TctC
LQGLAVANTTRIKALPDTPTMGDAGYPSVAMGTWYGVSAPAKTPRDVVNKLHAAIAQTLNTAKYREKMEAQGAEIFVKNPDEFAAFLQADAKLMLELIKAANMTAPEN